MLSLTLLWAAWMKLFTPIEELARVWHWVGEVSINFVKFTGITDLLGGLGLILHPLLKMGYKLVAMAAAGVLVLMVCAAGFHISRGEASQIGINIVFAVLAGFIAWGRYKTLKFNE